MAWSFWGSKRGSESSDETASQADDVYSLFFNCFFLPMLADGKLDDEEFTPLEAAYFGLNVDAMPFDLVKHRLLGEVDNIRHKGKPSLDGSFCDLLYEAWSKKIDWSTGLPRITENQREELFKWVSTTMQRHTTPLARDLREREEEKVGRGGTSSAGDARYQSHLRKYGVGQKRPIRDDRERVANLFREIADRLKTIDEGLIPRATDEAVASGPQAIEQSSSSAKPPAVVDAAGGGPSALPSAGAGAETPTAANSSSGTSAALAPTGSAPQGTAGPSSAAPLSLTAAAPAASGQPLPAPPSVIDNDVTDLLREQPSAVAVRQKTLAGKSKDILEAVSLAFGDFSLPQQSPLAFSQNRTTAKGQVVIVPEADLPQDANLWFIGDMHGDILALDAAVQYIDSQTTDATIVFLGDLFDDRGFGYEVVLRVFELIVSRPRRIGYIVGNHDVALGMRTDPELVFSSSVSPSDFAEFLNERRDDNVSSALGRLLVRFFQAAPRALFLPDGLIVAHAGVPLGIRWESIKCVADLERDDCLQDFTWTRAHERARKKIPNPSSKTSEFGFEDFSAFCDFVSTTLGLKAERIVRGHDHFEAGYSIYPKWVRNQCVTINTMSRRLPRDPFGTFHRTPCVARWVSGKAPEVHRLTVPGNLIDAYYKPETSSDGESPVKAAGTV